MKAFLIILYLALLICSTLVVASIPYEGNVSLYWHELTNPYNCSDPVPDEYEMLRSEAGEFTAKYHYSQYSEYYLSYYKFYRLYLTPESVFSDSCKCKAFIRFHYDEVVSENRRKKSFK